MFARTERLTLRPAWPEDAAALAAARRDERGGPPTDLPVWFARPCEPHEPCFLIFAHQGGAPALIGGVGIVGEEFGLWLTPTARARGYGTEAGRAVVDIAHHALPLRRLFARRAAEDRATDRMLRKLGFAPTGERAEHRSRTSLSPGPSVELALDLRRSRPPVLAAA